MYGYYPLSPANIEKLMKNPRGHSLTFDCTETTNEPILNLIEYKVIEFLVKSTSRFFLKPDIGEVFDQIDFRDLLTDKIKAICVEDEYLTLEGTEGEHYIMRAILLTNN